MNCCGICVVGFQVSCNGVTLNYRILLHNFVDACARGAFLRSMMCSTKNFSPFWSTLSAAWFYKLALVLRSTEKNSVSKFRCTVTVLGDTLITRNGTSATEAKKLYFYEHVTPTLVKLSNGGFCRS